MQQELAARALRACMAAEAAMASLRAECKPLQTASPQRVRALNIKNMGNAHRSLQLQIEACESFSLSATAAFKQLCDVIFCTDSEKSMNLEHNSMFLQRSNYSKTSKAQPSDLSASIDGEVPDCGLWKSESNALDHSPARSEGVGEGIPVDDIAERDHSAGVQVTEAQDTLLWGPENGAIYTRFPSPETDNEATDSQDIGGRRSIEVTDWSRQLDSQHVKDREARVTITCLLLHWLVIHACCRLITDLRCDILSFRNNSIISTDPSEIQLDDGFKLHKTRSESISANTKSLTYAVEHAGNSTQNLQQTTSDSSELDSEHEHHATKSMEIHLDESTKPSCLVGEAEAAFPQTMDGDISPPYISDAHSGVSSRTATGSPPPASSSSNEVQERCDSYNPIDLQPATPSFSTPIHASWTMAEVTCTQTPSSSASQFSWSCETTRSVDKPSTTQSLSILQYNPRVPYASVERWDPNKSSSDLPLYPAHLQSSKQIGTSPAPASSAVRGLHQEFNPTVLSFDSQDLAVRKLQPLFNKEIGHSPSSPSSADENHFVEPNVPLTPSPYTLKMRSMFSRANLARKPSSGHSIPAPMQSTYGHSDGNLFSMATSVSLSSGYRQPSMSSGLSAGSSAYVSVMEKQALQIISETPLLPQFSVSPVSSSISTSSLSWESPASPNNSGGDSSGRDGSLDNYKRKLENLQEQFPRAHGSFRGEPQSLWGTRRVGALVSNPVGNSSLQNACKIPWQTSHMSTITTEVERYVGAPFEGKHISVQRRPTDAGVEYVQGNVSDYSVCYGRKGSLESDSRYNGIVQGSRYNESQVSEVGVRSTINSDSRDLTSSKLNRKDSAQKSQSRTEQTSWRWNDDQSSKETGQPLPVSSNCRTSDVAMVGGAAGDCPRVKSTMRLTQSSDTEDDDYDSSSTEREWNNILISLQQRGEILVDGKNIYDHKEIETNPSTSTKDT
ncbi:hypothetical protein KC19_7G179100 [Ceratodon purpureus]|uniref:Uncharacterized protein n=1 Tax=Ceratodon purpureus TaxID=3225 RepID=A0A8T0HBF4_CERPU|nr:hypothetical protein KC19_7G179100 [Ceratodon purpureus]